MVHGPFIKIKPKVPIKSYLKKSKFYYAYYSEINILTQTFPYNQVIELIKPFLTPPTI